MAILDELFGPLSGVDLSRLPDMNSPEALQELLRRIQDEQQPGMRPSGLPGITLQDTPPQNLGVAGKMPGPEVPPFPQAEVTMEPPPVASPAPMAPMVAAPRIDRAPPSEESNPMERLGAILMGLGDRGQGALARIGGAMTAGPAFDRGRREENSTLRALMDSDPSMTMDRARTIARNPQALAAYFGPRAGPTFGVIGTDQFGSQIHGWIDPRNRTVTRADLTGGGNGGGTEPPAGQVDPQQTGQAFLETINDPGLRSQIVGITEGRLPYPTGQYARTPQGRRLMALINQYDPTFTAATYQARAATLRDFATGTASRNVRALNTVMGHLDTLNTAIDGLGNFTRLPAINVPWNAVRGQFSPDFQAAYSRFSTARQAVASELMRVFREVGASTTEIQEWLRTMETAASPVALREGVQTAMELINSRLVAMNDSYNRAMGTRREPTELLSPEARAVFDRLGGRGRTDEAAPPPPGEAPPRRETPDAAAIPPIPQGVPAGAQWSASRQQWRGPNGQLFDNQGRRLGTQ